MGITHPSLNSMVVHIDLLRKSIHWLYCCSKVKFGMSLICYIKIGKLVRIFKFKSFQGSFKELTKYCIAIARRSGPGGPIRKTSWPRESCNWKQNMIKYRCTSATIPPNSISYLKCYGPKVWYIIWMFNGVWKEGFDDFPS